MSEFLHHYSKEKERLVFLQIGANDGFIYDPLQKFIKRDDWEGVLVEPQPYVHDNLLTKIHAKRPEIKTVNAALAEKDGSANLFTLSVSKERWANGLSSFNKQVLIDRIKDGTIQKKALKEGVRLPDENDFDAWIEPIKIKTISPKTLLAKFEGKQIDLVAIDTEGYDFEIIKLLNIKNLLPEVLIYDPSTPPVRCAHLRLLPQRRMPCSRRFAGHPKTSAAQLWGILVPDQVGNQKWAG